MTRNVLLLAVLVLSLFTFNSCSLMGEDDDLVEIIALSIDGETAVEMDNIYCSFDDDHLYISGSGMVNGTFTNVTFSIFGMTKGETGTFACEDYATTTDCLRLNYSEGAYTSGEYTGDSGSAASLLILEESGDVMQGAFSGVLEKTNDPDDFVSVGVGFVVKADD